ncbi:unnamed protein product [Echinostoma caproni]|uniref:G_PROTEIN_RECEP_F1_2 domain-containing protein n=1 Tax=Echinostoma caproni TaxID=27848 RepID=A0A183ADI7_9TREM|nr:unnamed protein product [Echinostoma caproni]
MSPDVAESQDQTAPTNKTPIGYKYNSWMAFADRFIPWAIWADRYVTLIYYIIGFPGNLISMIVWTSRRVYKGNSAAIYLAALSLNDIIILIFALHRDLDRNWGVFARNTPGACEVLNTVFSAVQYASPLYVLGFTVERWLAVCRPFLIKRICNAKRAMLICCLICSGTLIICLGNAVRFGTEPTHCYKKIDGFAINFYLATLEAIFSGIVPLMVLIFNCLVIRELARVHRTNKTLESTSNRLTGGTTATKSTVSRSKQLEHSRLTDLLCCRRSSQWPCQSTRSYSGVAHVPLVRESCGSDCLKPPGRPSKSGIGSAGSNGTRGSFATSQANPEERHSPSFRSTTFMLLCVSFYMIIATLLAGSMYLLNHIFDEPDLTLTEDEALKDRQWLLTMRILTIKTFADEIAMSYYAFGFIIYYATGHSFRERVHQLFRMMFVRCGCCRDSFAKYGHSDELEFTSATRRPQRRITSPRSPSLNPTVVSEYNSNLLDQHQITNNTNVSGGAIPYKMNCTEHPPENSVNDHVESLATNGINKVDTHSPVPEPRSETPPGSGKTHSAEITTPLQQTNTLTHPEA